MAHRFVLSCERAAELLLTLRYTSVHHARIAHRRQHRIACLQESKSTLRTGPIRQMRSVSCRGKNLSVNLVPRCVT